MSLLTTSLFKSCQIKALLGKHDLEGILSIHLFALIVFMLNATYQIYLAEAGLKNYLVI